MITWEELNPNYAYHVFDYDGIKLFKLKNDKLFEEFMAKKEYHGACDVARIEIVERLGGIYLDADSICLKTLEGAPFMKKDFVAVYDHEVVGHEGRINNGVIGAIRHHPILKDYIAKMSQAKDIRPPWRTIGGELLTQCVREHGEDKKVEILPAYSFWPENHNGKKVEIKGEVYAKQLWGTTKNLY